MSLPRTIDDGPGLCPVRMSAHEIQEGP
jgi:hypothetical protein